MLHYRWCIGTLQAGFRLWHQNGRFIKTLELPNTVRNVNKSWGVSNSLVMSREDVYAVAGIRLVTIMSLFCCIIIVLLLRVQKQIYHRGLLEIFQSDNEFYS